MDTVGSERTSSMEVSRLEEERLYSDRRIRLRPAAADHHPTIGSEEAYRAWEAAGVYLHAPDESPRPGEMAFGLFHESPGEDTAEPTLEPGSGRPVWIVTFREVPDFPAGPPAPPGEERAPVEASVQDVVALVDADTGEPILIISEPAEPRAD